MMGDTSRVATIESEVSTLWYQYHPSLLSSNVRWVNCNTRTCTTHELSPQAEADTHVVLTRSILVPHTMWSGVVMGNGGTMPIAASFLSGPVTSTKRCSPFLELNGIANTSPSDFRFHSSGGDRHTGDFICGGDGGNSVLSASIEL